MRKILNYLKKIIEPLLRKRLLPAGATQTSPLTTLANPTVTVSKTPGLKCPECGMHIVVSIQQLINYQPVQCATCGLELHIDQSKSEGSIAALSRLQESINTATEQQKKALS